MGQGPSGGVNGQNGTKNHQNVAADNQNLIQDVKVKKSFSEFE